MKKRFFTLTELLVVIAILALLAGLILPSLNKARDKGKAISCLANLKQIGTAILAYSTDSNGFFPAKCTAQHSTATTRTMLPVLLNSYIPAKSTIYICPNDKGKLYQQEGTSYIWNWMQTEYPGNEKSGSTRYDATPFGVVNAAEFILLVDADKFHGSGPKGYNVLYADYHVANGLNIDMP